MEEESKQKTKKQMKEEKIAREHARDTDIKASRLHGKNGSCRDCEVVYDLWRYEYVWE